MNKFALISTLLVLSATFTQALTPAELTEAVNEASKKYLNDHESALFLKEVINPAMHDGLMSWISKEDAFVKMYASIEGSVEGTTEKTELTEPHKRMVLEFEQALKNSTDSKEKKELKEALIAALKPWATERATKVDIETCRLMIAAAGGKIEHADILNMENYKIEATPEGTARLLPLFASLRHCNKGDLYASHKERLASLEHPFTEFIIKLYHNVITAAKGKENVSEEVKKNISTIRDDMQFFVKAMLDVKKSGRFGYGFGLGVNTESVKALEGIYQDLDDAASSVLNATPAAEIAGTATTAVTGAVNEAENKDAVGISTIAICGIAGGIIVAGGAAYYFIFKKNAEDDQF